MLRRKDNRKAVVATKELLQGQSNIQSAKKTSDNHFDLEYTGETEIHWNSQRVVVEDGQRVFFDEDGDEVLENDIELVDE